MKPIFFKNQKEFRTWLEKNHQTEKEILVGYYKVKTGKASLTWSQSVDEAICFGWIDGVRKSIDEESYCIRFTPRNPKSNWSNVNLKKVEELTAKGLMHPKGLDVYSKRKVSTDNEYSYENEPKVLPDQLEQKIKKNDAAWQFFSTQSTSYKKTIIHWILNAKQDKTKENRMEKLIKACELKEKLF